MVDDETDWESIVVIDDAPLPITYPWHFVCEIGEEWLRLCFIAKGRWNCLGDALVPCNPDGHAGLPLAAEQLLIAKCAPGALIGKLGGSIAGRDDGKLFAIGSR